jgi:hypothetical protein
MKKLIIAIALLLYFISPAAAHVIRYDLDKDKLSGGQVFWKYIVLGFEHIIPLGLDHILFILCIFFINSSLKAVILQASMFTLAHSITLGLATYEVINPPAQVVEPLIALSIVLLALENIFTTTVKPWRMGVVFLFGLIHGMGFAGVLGDLGIPRKAFLAGLIGFNIGVELGQIAIILAMYLLVSRNFGSAPWYRRRLVIPVSVVIGLVASYWTVERIFW